MRRIQGVVFEFEGDELELNAVLVRLGVAYLRYKNGGVDAKALQLRDRLAAEVSALRATAQPASVTVVAASGGQALSTAAAASLIGVSPQRVRVLCDSGALPAVRTPSGWRIDPASAAALAARRKGALPMDRRFCSCQGCAGCSGASRHVDGSHGAIFDYPRGGAPIKCAACNPGQARHAGQAPVTERRSAPQSGRTTMTERPSDFFKSLGPGSNRNLSVPQLQDMQRQAEQLEQRAAVADHLEQRAAEVERRASLQVAAEPVTYQRGGPNSFFADIARVATGRGDNDAAERRLARHEDELAVMYPAWRESRRQAAQRAYEQEFLSTRRAQILLERMERHGLYPFRTEDALERNYERRAISRNSASAGYFTPPLWILEAWAMAPRAGRAFADLWTSMPLPPGTAQINVPHWVTGLSTGPQVDGGAVVGDSPADSFSSCNVVTISGYQDVSMQWAEQAAPPGADAFVFGDLMDDAGGNLDAQLLIGAGTAGTLTGIIVAGAAAAANLVTIANSQNVSGSTLTAASGATPVYTSAARMLKVMGKARGRRATHVVLNEATWWDLAGTIDTTGKPILPLSASAPEPGPDSALGTAWGLPVIGDNQLPLTFGGTTAPTVAASGAVTAATAGNGSYAVILAVRAPDLYLFEGDIRVRVMQEIVSGTGQWRFQVLQYAAALRDRYTAGAAISISAGTDTGGVNTGGTPSAGVVTNYQSNSPLASE